MAVSYTMTKNWTFCEHSVIKTKIDIETDIDYSCSFKTRNEPDVNDKNILSSSSTEGLLCDNNPIEAINEIWTNEKSLKKSESYKPSTPSLTSSNKFINSNDENKNLDSSSSINSIKNEDLSGTRKDATDTNDEAGYESWTEEDWPIKTESHQSPLLSPISSNEFINNNDETENVDSCDLMDSIKNEDLFGTRKNATDATDEAGFESWTEEDWPIKTESHQSPILSPISSNDEEQNVDSSKLINPVNEDLSKTVEDSIDKVGYESWTEEDCPIKTESHQSSILSTISSNEFINSNDETGNVDSCDLMDIIKNEDLFGTRKDATDTIDEAGYESWTEEDCPIKTEPHQPPGISPISLNPFINGNDEEQNINNSHLINSINERRFRIEQDSIDTNKCDVSKNDSFKCYICDKIFRKMNHLENHMISHKTTFRENKECANNTFSEEILKTSHTNSRMVNVERENSSDADNEMSSDRINSKRRSHRILLLSEKETLKPNKFKYPAKFNKDDNDQITTTQDPYQRYECNICKKVFTAKSDLKLHIFNHTRQKTYQCYICGIKYPSAYRLTRHMVATHKSKKIYKCEVCAKIFKHPSALNKHQIVHTDERPFECYLCKNKFKRKIALDAHLVIHNDLRPFECDMCKSAFKIKYKLRSHIVSVHQNIKQFECRICKKVFTIRNDLKQHILTHTGQTSFQCDICGKKCPSIHAFNRHIAADHQSKIYKCEICAKIFKHPSWLTNHKLIHSDERPFQCYFCEKRFKRKIELDSHLVIHSDSRSFECSECKCTFKLKSNLRHHIVRVHRNIRPFECNICKATFKRKQTLQYHVASVHENKKPFKCDICKNTFASKQNLQGHIFSVHEKRRSFKCKMCQNTFATKQKLQGHIIRFHMT